MGGEEIAERLRQEFGQRIGIGQEANLPLDAFGILRELAVHALCLLQQHARVMNEGAARRRRLHTLALAVQQGRAERRLHIADARARSGDGEMHALGAMRDAARFDDIEKQPQIAEIETHGNGLRILRSKATPNADCVNSGAASDFGKHEGEES